MRGKLLLVAALATMLNTSDAAAQDRATFVLNVLPLPNQALRSCDLEITLSNLSDVYITDLAVVLEVRNGGQEDLLELSFRELAPKSGRRMIQRTLFGAICAPRLDAAVLRVRTCRSEDTMFTDCGRHIGGRVFQADRSQTTIGPALRP